MRISDWSSDVCSSDLAIAFLWAATAVTPAATQQAEAPDMPAIAGSLPPTPVREAQAAVVRADYRYDDLLWENDRIEHRIYGNAREAAEPHPGSGLDPDRKCVA